MTRPAWRHVAAAALLAAATLAGCSHGSTTDAALPRSRCAHGSEANAYDGPLNWQIYGTEIAGRTWFAATRPLYFGDLSLMTSHTIVLDSVTIDNQDPTHFSPVRLQGAWVTSRPAVYNDGVAQWPGPKTDLSCFVVSAQPKADDVSSAPVLIVRLTASSPEERNGREWSANRAIVVRYHTLDGHEYAAPYGFVNVYPNSPDVDVDNAGQYLAKPVPNAF